MTPSLSDIWYYKSIYFIKELKLTCLITSAQSVNEYLGSGFEPVTVTLSNIWYYKSKNCSKELKSAWILIFRSSG